MRRVSVERLCDTQEGCEHYREKTLWCNAKNRTIMTIPNECSDYTPKGKQKKLIGGE